LSSINSHSQIMGNYFIDPFHFEYLVIFFAFSSVDMKLGLAWWS